MLNLFRRAKAANEKIEERPEDNVKVSDDEVAAYLLIERDIPGIAEYAARFGLYLQNVFTNIEDAKVAMMIERRPTRLIIIEVGSGKFTRTTTRQDLVDLIGLCTVGKKIIVFYTNSLLKSEIQKTPMGKSGGIIWYKYKTTMDAIQQVLKLKERYVKVDIQPVEIDVNELLNFRGERCENECISEMTPGKIKVEEPWEITKGEEPLVSYDANT